ncbi:bifunctional diaminohydroxyphosphoribosylaminopyrimidine deaminase/5-amino-6-(5-phosphoribosylamino)uracil reductase RibD [Gloeothece verrucosa]|uniref:Riboflavin biosynthesis protein RibD n=1 Tax=Gloeothece verrucosa (strain PCC 7822) TaxID=497965 RepID=E0UKB1_GLOV7|nr:bifunctional diaminohydroxyphosphoribosylaminopyrimidine deaminase/5-amino-6-(5-phosphoribosylamino)uracil reductase RibD [Gloeothece verrucosa]ADN15873.1 riboflavin biosynthesis protein RibD [Gloeothece verrucosa PCC 7822]
MNTSSEFQASAFDREMMQRCITLARKALGATSPNPMVGAVIVREQEIVGEGFHPGAGQPHAEVFALSVAAEKAKGATIYINLEPCNHYGRTPPCTEALIKAGIAKVMVGMIDPDPRVSGKGIERLTEAGIEVVAGIEEEACRRLNEGFIHRVLYQRPFGILKYAMTLDGKIAATSGHSAWVTGEASRRIVHQLRAACDAVIIGGNTVRQDNPHLTTHGVSSHNPLRVVMSRSLNLPLEANLWETDKVPTVVFTEEGINPPLQKQLLKRKVEVIELEVLTPTQVMQHLYQRGFCSVLWECGGTLAASAITEGMVQKVMAFIAPKIIGGESAPSPVGDLGLDKMSNALQLQRVALQRVDNDFVIEGYLPMS